MQTPTFFAGGIWPQWLQRTAERQSARVNVPDHVTERRETCHVESVDGFKVLKCTQTREVLRRCADGHREVIEHTTTTTVQPYEPCGSSSGPSGNSSGRYDTVMDGPLAPVVSATLGQMLDDFFQYAAELQQSLEQHGVNVSEAASDRSWLRDTPSPGQAGGSSSSGSSSGGGGSNSSDGSSSSSRLFGWWQRRRPVDGVVGDAPQGSQPSLQQLVRESSSDVLEI